MGDLDWNKIIKIRGAMSRTSLLLAFTIGGKKKDFSSLDL